MLLIVCDGRTNVGTRNLKKEAFFIIYLISCLPWVEMFCAQSGISVLAIGAGTTASQAVETFRVLREYR